MMFEFATLLLKRCFSAQTDFVIVIDYEIELFELIDLKGEL